MIINMHMCFYSLAICQKLQTNFTKLKIVEKKMRNKEK
jgi:hypothetical protein